MHRTLVGRVAFVTLVLSMLPAGVAAQEAGIKAGVNIATLSDPVSELPDDSDRIGATGGLWLRMPRSNWFSVQIEGLYSEKGRHFESSAFETDTRLRYIEVPILARFDLGAQDSPARVFFVGGVAPAFKLGARVVATFEGIESQEDIADRTETFDFGLAAGLGVEFGRVSVEARYTHGLRKIAVDHEDSADFPRNRALSVTAGIRFR